MKLDSFNIDTIDFWEGVVMLVDKPYGFTSFDIVHQLRARARKSGDGKLKFGHAGTLDPLATGLLILATGKKTKSLEEYQALSKTYSGRFTLGYERPSYDMETGIIDCKPCKHLTDADLEKARMALTGQLWIKPPMHSAVKIDGKRAYKMARKGEEAKLESRLMQVNEFSIDSSDFPEIAFRIYCSKGTYIRSLAYEFGKLLGCGAYLSALKREAIGNFSVEESWNFRELCQLLDLRIKR